MILYVCRRKLNIYLYQSLVVMTNITEAENKMGILKTKSDNGADMQILETVSDHLYDGVTSIIDKARMQVAVYINAHTSMTFWSVGKYIVEDMDYQTYSAYGKKILATLSQRLTSRYGKGYTYSALTRMMKVARIYSNREMFAMLSQTLSWSHFLELITIKDPTKRLFYQQMDIAERWSVQQLRDKQDTLSYLCLTRIASRLPISDFLARQAVVRRQAKPFYNDCEGIWRVGYREECLIAAGEPWELPDYSVELTFQS